MTSKRRVRIPQKDQPPLIEFFKLDSSKRNAILDFINDDKVIGHGVAFLEEELSKQLPYEDVDYEYLCEVFFKVCRTKIEYEIDDNLFVEEFSRLFEKNDIKGDDIKNDIVRILNSKILITAKAINLILSEDKVFLTSKIITDLRPLFNMGKEILLMGNLLTVSLNIEYKHNREDNENVSIALDEDDLIQLKDQISRAEEKLKVLRSNNFKIVELK